MRLKNAGRKIRIHKFPTEVLTTSNTKERSGAAASSTGTTDNGDSTSTNENDKEVSDAKKTALEQQKSHRISAFKTEINNMG